MNHTQQKQEILTRHISKHQVRKGKNLILYSQSLPTWYNSIHSGNRVVHQKNKTLMQKIHYNSVYRSACFNLNSAIQPIAQIVSNSIDLIYLRLAFGSAACCNEWCIISETVTNLANYIMGQKSWDTEELHYPIQH